MSAFSGQVALVTGASSGIGAALARELARQGADLVLAARRVDRLQAVAMDIEGTGRACLVAPCDVTIDGDLERVVAEARARFGHIDVAVANAGFGVVGPLASLSLTDYRRQFETNVFGVLRTIYATLPELQQRRGRLAIIGSVAGWVATPGSSPYSMSKFAVRALADALAHELAPSGVSVTLISPGLVTSEIRRVDNQGRLRDEEREPVPDWLVMPVEKAARLIARAIARRRHEVDITGHGKFAVFVQRHTPRLLAWGMRRSGIRSRREPHR